MPVDYPSIHDVVKNLQETLPDLYWGELYQEPTACSWLISIDDWPNFTWMLTLRDNKFYLNSMLSKSHCIDVVVDNDQDNCFDILFNALSFNALSQKSLTPYDWFDKWSNNDIK